MMQSSCKAPALVEVFFVAWGLLVSHFHWHSHTGAHLSDVRSKSNLEAKAILRSKKRPWVGKESLGPTKT